MEKDGQKGISFVMRNTYIDKIRGFAIILVVLGHAIQHTYENFDSNYLFTFIYSFHMPLFMFISGYVTYKENREPDKEWMRRRTASLLIPFLVWIPFPYIFSWDNQTVVNHIVQVIKDPTWSNWFLLILFLLSLSMWGLHQIGKRLHIKIEILIAIYIMCFLLMRNCVGGVWSGIGLMAKYSVYYFGGYLCNKWFKKIFSSTSGNIFIGVLAIGWILFVSLWRRVGYHAIFSEDLLARGIIRPIVKIVDTGFDYAIGFGGIAFSFIIVWLMGKCYKGKLLEKIGTKTLEIYLLHRMWFNMIELENVVIAVVLQTILGLAISYLISELFVNNTVGVFLFGMKRRDRNESV